MLQVEHVNHGVQKGNSMNLYSVLLCAGRCLLHVSILNERISSIRRVPLRTDASTGRVPFPLIDQNRSLPAAWEGNLSHDGTATSRVFKTTLITNTALYASGPRSTADSCWAGIDVVPSGEWLVVISQVQDKTDSMSWLQQHVPSEILRVDLHSLYLEENQQCSIQSSASISLS